MVYTGANIIGTIFILVSLLDPDQRLSRQSTQDPLELKMIDLVVFRDGVRSTQIAVGVASYSQSSRKTDPN
jgi:hypothetical protein